MQRQGWRVGQRGRAIRRKEAASFGLARIGVEHLDGFGPDRLLRIIEFPQIEYSFLMHVARSRADIFLTTPIRSRWR